MHCCDHCVLHPLRITIPTPTRRGVEEAVPPMLEGRCVWYSPTAPGTPSKHPLSD